MFTVPAERYAQLQAQGTGMRQDRLPWWNIWRDLADFILPKRYVWLLSDKERKMNNFTNPAINDGTGTQAARILAAGLMNGIASPSRPWFKLKLRNWMDETSHDVRVWLDEVEKRMMYVMGASNFYNALAVYFLDLVVFGTASLSIFDDPTKVIHCQNHALGEFYCEVDARGQLCTFRRHIMMTVYQMITEFGEENCSDNVRQAYAEGKARLREPHEIVHHLEKNDYDYATDVAKGFAWREYYYDLSDSDVISGGGRRMLRVKGYYERPTIVSRWEVSGTDPYGTSPGMDALADIKQLQHETRRKGQGLDYMVQPPMLADITMENRPFAMLPRGITYVPRLDATTVGAKPAWQVNLPIGEITADINQIQQRIANIFYNFLFNKVMNLATVRSAREIDSIEQERLVLLGGALERIENEGLDPVLERVYGLMFRAKMFPPAPPEIKAAELQIEYVSILAAAQSAAGTASTERFLQLIGTLAGIWPEAREVPEIVDTISDYGADIGVPAKNIRSKDQIAAIVANQNQQAQAAQQIDNAQKLAQGAQVASQTDVGGGTNLLQRMLSGGGA